MNDLVIFGAGGFGREFHQIVEDVNQQCKSWNLLGFLDENCNLFGKEVHGYPILGGISWLQDHPGVYVSVAIGNPAVKRKLVLMMRGLGHDLFATLVHPRAWLGNRVSVGSGSILFAGALVSTDIRIHEHVMINKNATVGHDAVLADFVTVAPNASVSGAVTIDIGCDVGANSTIIQEVVVGPWSIIGAGAVVTKNMPGNVTVVGVPAKVIKERPEGWHESV